jgi:HAD superfamily hydrolase (TIGR01509 family)
MLMTANERFTVEVNEHSINADGLFLDNDGTLSHEEIHDRAFLTLWMEFVETHCSLQESLALDFLDHEDYKRQNGQTYTTVYWHFVRFLTNHHPNKIIPGFDEFNRFYRLHRYRPFHQELQRRYSSPGEEILFADAERFLKRIEDVTRIIVTSSPRRVIEAYNLKLENTLGFGAITREDVQNPKPDPASYRLARLHTTAELPVAIEDSSSGVRAALAANIPTIVFIRRYPEHPLLKELEQYVHAVDSLDEIEIR